MPWLRGERTIIGLSVARSTGEVAFAASYPEAPPEVFMTTADGTGERRLTDMNLGWKGEVEIARPERFTYRRDGVEIDGWVLRPVGREAGQRCPALLWIHGGPHREFSNPLVDRRPDRSRRRLRGDLHQPTRRATARPSAAPSSGTGAAWTTPISWRGWTRRCGGVRTSIPRDSA